MPKDKIFKGILLVFVITSVVAIWAKGDEFVPVENPDEELQGQDYVDYWDDLNEAYKKDNYGGTTPEETLNMFITALKVGDLELAIKYIVVEKQGEYQMAFDNWEKNGSLVSIIELIDKLEYSTNFNLDQKESRMIVLGKDNFAVFEMEFIKNTYSEKWKIYDF